MTKRFDIMNPVVVGFIDVQNYRLLEIADRFNNIFNTRAVMLRKCGEWKYTDHEIKGMLSVSDISRKSLWRDSVRPFKSKPSEGIMGMFKRPKSISALNGYSTFRKQSQEKLIARTFTQTDIINSKAIEAESEMVEEHVRPYHTSLKPQYEAIVINKKPYNHHDGWFATTDGRLETNESNSPLKFMAEFDKKDSEIRFINKDSIADMNSKLKANNHNIDHVNLTEATEHVHGLMINKPEIHLHEAPKPGLTVVTEHDISLNSGLSNFYIDDIPNYYQK